MEILLKFSSHIIRVIDDSDTPVKVTDPDLGFAMKSFFVSQRMRAERWGLFTETKMKKNFLPWSRHSSAHIVNVALLVYIVMKIGNSSITLDIHKNFRNTCYFLWTRYIPLFNSKMGTHFAVEWFFLWSFKKRNFSLFCRICWCYMRLPVMDQLLIYRFLQVENVL